MIRGTLDRVSRVRTGDYSCKLLGMHTVYSTNLVHKTQNENCRGTQTEVASLLTHTHTHTHTASDRKLGGTGNEVRTAVWFSLA